MAQNCLLKINNLIVFLYKYGGLGVFPLLRPEYYLRMIGFYGKHISKYVLKTMF